MTIAFAATAAQAAERVRIGLLKLSSAAPLFLAKERGYFEQEGIDVDFRFFDAAVPIAVATVSGDIDIGFTGFTAAFYNLAGKGGLKVIAGTAREAPGFQNTAYVASKRAYDAGLKTLKDLPNHSVGITQVGSTFHYSLGLIADKLKFDIGTVRVVPLQSLPNVAAAIKGGTLDAALTATTTISPVVASGDAVVLGFVGDETPWMLGCAVASTAAIDKNRKLIEKVLAAYRRGTEEYARVLLQRDADGKFVRSDEGDAMLAIISKYTEQKLETLRIGLSVVDPALDSADIARQVAWFKRQKMIEGDIEADKIIDKSFVPDKPTERK
ncbi:ABC transporter substrate-binding protein [Bradyrhizobium jicamae]|uniref:ABC transporter substrate-binding protein n=1 Tax=Bradyrhizobium jicamae TaxID=280332 RepID=UPI002012F767|nr:ABC transporter substrate-binding protein [Bradyrhizobium jicamae]